MSIQLLDVTCNDALNGQTEHFHDCHQIIYIVDGEISITISNDTYSASKGSLILVSRYEQHEITVVSNEYKRYTLEISPDHLENKEDDDLLTTILVNRTEGFRHVLDLHNQSAEIELILSNIEKEHKMQKLMHNTMESAMLKWLLVLIYRSAPHTFAVENSRGIGVIREIQNRFEQEYREIFFLNELAEEYHISMSHLSHMFKRVTGYAPMMYLQACRISAAKHYLANSTMTIKEIVFQCGFSDESNFCRIFRKETGLTASEFRKQFQNVPASD